LAIENGKLKMEKKKAELFFRIFSFKGFVPLIKGPYKKVANSIV
jgi:hypothetical protein